MSADVLVLGGGEIGTIRYPWINPELGDAQERLAIEYQEERLELGFNSKYFIDVLQVMESNEVELGIIDNASPCLLSGKDDQGFLGLIMPMRI